MLLLSGTWPSSQDIQNVPLFVSHLKKMMFTMYVYVCETSPVDKRVSPKEKFCHTEVVSGQEHTTMASAYKIKNGLLLFVMWVSFMVCFLLVI